MLGTFGRIFGYLIPQPDLSSLEPQITSQILIYFYSFSHLCKAFPKIQQDIQNPLKVLATYRQNKICLCPLFRLNITKYCQCFIYLQRLASV